MQVSEWIVNDIEWLADIINNYNPDIVAYKS